jgi:glucokinase
MKYTIGLDIGGTKITGVLFDGKKILKRLTIVTPKNKKDFVHSVNHLAAFLSVGLLVSHIGIGCAGIIDSKRKLVVQSPNIPYLKNFSFASLFKNHNVQVDNDANCFVRAENLVGSAKGLKNCVGLIFGTGVGSGLLLNGKIYQGSHFSAGEMGHSIIDMQHNKTIEQLFQAAKKSPSYEKHLVSVMGSVLVNTVNIFDPECIVLGGGVSEQYGKHILSETKSYIKKHIFNKQIQPKITISKLKDAGALGAALLWKN